MLSRRAPRPTHLLVLGHKWFGALPPPLFCACIGMSWGNLYLINTKYEVFSSVCIIRHKTNILDPGQQAHECILWLSCNVICIYYKCATITTPALLTVISIFLIVYTKAVRTFICADGACLPYVAHWALLVLWVQRGCSFKRYSFITFVRLKMCGALPPCLVCAEH